MYQNQVPHGNGFNGRVDGPLFDVRHLFVPASAAFTTIGESMQTEAQTNPFSLRDAHIVGETGIFGKACELMATAPVDMKALGLGMAAIAVSGMVHTAQTTRDIHFENGLITSGMSRAQAERPLGERASLRMKRLGVGLLGAVAAYGVGKEMSQAADFVASTGIIAAGVSYMYMVKKRFSGSF